MDKVQQVSEVGEAASESMNRELFQRLIVWLWMPNMGGG